MGAEALMRHSTWLPPVPFLILILLVRGGAARGDDRPAPKPETTDCGTIALRQLLRIEQKPATWEAVAARLGRPPQAGHSMKELRDVTQGLGLTLTGVKLAMKKDPLDRPAILS